jgi:hypothetical protein
MSPNALWFYYGTPPCKPFFEHRLAAEGNLTWVGEGLAIGRTRGAQSRRPPLGIPSHPVSVKLIAPNPCPMDGAPVETFFSQDSGSLGGEGRPFTRWRRYRDAAV